MCIRLCIRCAFNTVRPHILNACCVFMCFFSLTAYAYAFRHCLICVSVCCWWCLTDALLRPIAVRLSPVRGASTWARHGGSLQQCLLRWLERETAWESTCLRKRCTAHCPAITAHCPPICLSLHAHCPPIAVTAHCPHLTIC